MPFETVPGDFDADGDADARDYTIWATTFSYSEAREDVMDADASGNGEIDAADYVVWRHAIEPNAPSSSPTPEPSTLIEFAGALIIALSYRVNRRSIHSAIPALSHDPTRRPQE